MTRLQQHQQKQFKTRIVALVIFLILILYFIFSFGIRLLLNVSVYIANLGQKNSTLPITKTTDSFGSVSIDSIPSATNSAHIVVTGSVINFNLLEFYVNGDKVKNTTLDSSDSFSEEIGDLKNGENEVFIKGKIKDSTVEKQTQVYTVIYKANSPKLDISSPSDKAKVSTQEVSVKGATDKETYIKINDLPIVVDAQGNFQTNIKLKDGDNQIIVVAQDIAGNTETKSITVTYQKDN